MEGRWWCESGGKDDGGTVTVGEMVVQRVVEMLEVMAVVEMM